MLNRYFKITLRNPLRAKVNSFVGIAWLAIGVASCIFVFVYIERQFTADNYKNIEDTIYRIDIQSAFNGRTAQIPLTPAPLGPFLESRVTQVEHITRSYAPTVLTTMGRPILKNGEHVLRARRFIFVDSDFLDVFVSGMIGGDPKTALEAPFSVVLTQGAAEELFGKGNPIGQGVLYNYKFRFTVTGIVESPPPNSAVDFDCLGSMKSLPEVTSKSDVMTNGHKFDCYTYVLFKKSTNFEEIEKQIQRHISGFWDPVVRRTAGSPTIYLEPIGGLR